MYKLIHNDHTGLPEAIIREDDGLHIPVGARGNRDYEEFLRWNERQSKSKKIDLTKRITPPDPCDNLEEVLAQQDIIEARNKQIEEEKIAADKVRQKRFEDAVRAGRYNLDGTPTKAELAIIEKRKQKNREDWAKKVGKNPNRERCPQR